MAEKIRDYGKLAKDIIELVGGKDNIANAARCATRLRLVLKDTPVDAEEKIKSLPGVITVVQKQGQFQVVIGNHVGDVYEAVSKELNLEGMVQKRRSKERDIIESFLQMMSGVFAPICYILAAGGILQGILIILTMNVPSIADTGAYKIFNMISWAPFTFLPVMIAVTASKHFRCNTFVSLACCLALVSPTWTEMADQISKGTTIKFLFVKLTEITYTSSVLPPLVMIAMLAVLERFLNKHISDIISPLITPLICMAVMVPLTIVVIGPVIQGASNAVAAGYNALYAIAPPIAGAVVGGLWEIIVIFGIQWGMVPIVVANFAQNGYDTIQIFIQIAVIGQMAAAFAIFLKSREKELKANALSSGITAIFGITEPTLYGITLPRKKPFAYGCVWAAIGSAIAAIFGAKQYVYAGLPGLLSTVNAMSKDNPRSFIACMAGVIVTIIGTIVTIMILGYEDKKNIDTSIKSEEEIKKNTESQIYSPLKGQVKALSEVDDPTFSSGMLGKGIAINPEEGKVYAPFDGEVASIFDTKHAIGLKNKDGVEVLIHVGLETVNLGGKYYDAKVNVGDKVKKGDLLIEFEINEIKKEYDMITPIIISNSEDFEDIKEEKESGNVDQGELILTAKIGDKDE